MASTPLYSKAFKNRDVIIAVAVVWIIIMMIIPLPTILLDIFITINIALSLTILLMSMYIKETLDFASFPSLLLVMTLFRLSLNISATRRILLEGKAGQVIQQFGRFVIGGNVVVGLVIFLILAVIQFLVITKGSERVSEVAARFTLDAMPGKQMSIDADMNSGLITEDEARKRRSDVQREANFYGAMDGASKFVKGDAIAGIIIILINIIGGMAVGLLQMDMDGVGEVFQTFTLLSVGSGLVTMVPALMMATATGIIVTRSASENSLGQDLADQIFNDPKVIAIVAVVLFVLGIIPGLPGPPFFLAGALMGILAYLIRRSQASIITAESEVAAQAEVAEIKRPESVYSLLHVDPLELELGYGLIPLVDNNQGGDLLDRVVMIRRQCATEMGIVIPPIRIRDNMQLPPSTYILKLKGVPLGKGEIMLGHYLAMGGNGEIQGIPTQEPAFGLPAMWINENLREQAEMAGYTVVDAPSVLATHITEFLRSNAADILTRQDIKALLDNLRKDYPAVVDEVTPNLLSLAEIHKILSNLLRERVPIRDLISILEALGDWAPFTKDPDLLTEYVRQKISHQLGQLYSDEEGKIYCITLSPQVEEIIRDGVQAGDRGAYLAIEPSVAQEIIRSLNSIMETSSYMGKQIVVLASPLIRIYFYKLIERVAPGLPVLSYNEIPANLDIESVGVVNI